MSESIIYLGCFRCKGTGIEPAQPPVEEGGEPIPERPCPYCGGDGKKAVALILDTTELMHKLNTINTSCNQMEAKLQAIWNKVK